MAITLTGLASGLDTESVIAQLMAIEQNKVTAVQRRQIGITQHKTDLAAVKTKLDAVKSAAQDLTSAATWKASQTTTSSDPTKVDVQLLGGAGIGGQAIKIERLASSAQRGFTFTPSDDPGKLTLGYADPGDTLPVTIDVPAKATVSDLATAINANEKSPVYAAVVKDGGVDYLVLSARKSGSNSDFTVDTSQLGSGGQVTEAPGDKFKRLTDLDAKFTVGATEYTSETNVIENAIPGVRLTLKGIAESPVSINTTAAAIDTEGIVKKVTALVDAYNALVTATRSELSEKKVPTASTTTDLQKGQLFGDSGLSSMLNAMKMALVTPLKNKDPDDASPITLALKSLGDLGIGVPKATGGASSEDAKAGKLVIDTEKLKSVLAADHTKVRELFAGTAAVKGLTDVISDYVGTQTSSNGILTGRIESDDTRLKDFTKQIDKLNARMATEEKRLKAQFAAMEAALNFSQTQQAWLTSQIATLPTYY
jgi:flagellar hook-associated protein 2